MKIKLMLLVILFFFNFNLKAQFFIDDYKKETMMVLLNGALSNPSQSTLIKEWNNDLGFATLIKNKDHMALFDLKDKEGLVVIVTKAKMNAPENKVVIEKLAKLNYWGNIAVNKEPLKDANGNLYYDFVAIDKQPEFPGGTPEFNKYLSKSIRYPAIAQENNIQGKVFLSFVVEKDGTLTDIAIVKGIGGGCDEEAIRVIKASPNWSPGILKGKPVRVKFNINVNFRLDNSDKTNNMALILDGKLMPFHPDSLKKIKPEDADLITVVKEKGDMALFGVTNRDGLLIIITKVNKDSKENIALKAKIATIDFKKPVATGPKLVANSKDIYDFVSIEKQPQFPGGVKKFREFLSQNLRYPNEAQRNNVYGKVFLSFVVEKDGSITNINITRGLGSGCDEEAVRVLKLSPNWEPGFQNGKPVRVKYNINVSFNLN